MATSIPRGIQAVVWKNKDKSTSVRYRVRIKRKDYKEDRLFDTLEEAKEFLQLSKSKIGREQIFLKTEKETQEQKFIQEYFSQPPLIEYVKMYLQKYINTLPAETDLERRRRDNNKSFLKACFISNKTVKYLGRLATPSTNEILINKGFSFLYLIEIYFICQGFFEL